MSISASGCVFDDISSSLDFSPSINVSVYDIFKYDNLYIQLGTLFQ